LRFKGSAHLRPLRQPRTWWSQVSTGMCAIRSTSPSSQSSSVRPYCSAIGVLLGALFWLAFHLFVLAYEEPTLQRTFGAEYEAYRANVQRWIPRVTPWRAPEAGSRQPAKK